MNETQRVRLDEQLLRLRAEDDYVVLEDRDGFLEVVTGSEHGRVKRLVLDGEGVVRECRNL